MIEKSLEYFKNRLSKPLSNKRREAYQDAVKALEKQFPKKPIEYEDKYYTCPTCGNVLMYKWEKYPTVLTDRKNGLPCCLSCLQAIDWSES